MTSKDKKVDVFDELVADEWDEGSDYAIDEDDCRWNECHHGFIPAHKCPQCDEEIEARGGIDKCLNCGSYKLGDQLNKDQVCKIRCRNPNEY